MASETADRCHQSRERDDTVSERTHAANPETAARRVITRLSAEIGEAADAAERDHPGGGSANAGRGGDVNVPVGSGDTETAAPW